MASANLFKGLGFRPIEVQGKAIDQGEAPWCWWGFCVLYINFKVYFVLLLQYNSLCQY